MTAVRPITRVSIWSRTMHNAESLAKKIEKLYDIKVYDEVSMAVRDADIICTATSSTEPLIHLNNIQPHVHINAIGAHSKSMQEIGQDVLGHSVIFIDQLEAVLSESGELIKAVEQNTLRKENLNEIGQWLLTKDKDYKNQSTVFKSVGLAIQDLSVAEVVYRNALRNNLGSKFSLN